MVEQRIEEIVRAGMEHEIGDRHLSGEDKGNRAGKEAKQQQRAADQFQRGSGAENAHPFQRVLRRTRKAEGLGGAVQDEHISAGDAHQGKNGGLVRGEESHD